MVQKLEDELGCLIFDRSMQPIEPTEAGKQILQQAQIILFNIRQLKENVVSMKGGLTGSLSLAMIPTVAPYLLPKFIAAFRKSFPEISLQVTELRTETIIEKLNAAEIDMSKEKSVSITTPCFFAFRTTLYASMLCNMLFAGIHPSLTQTPPKDFCSKRTTLRPCRCARW